jgi:hypothetical protein
MLTSILAYILHTSFLLECSGDVTWDFNRRQLRPCSRRQSERAWCSVCVCQGSTRSTGHLLEEGRFCSTPFSLEPLSLVIRRRFGTLWSATAWPYIVTGICFLTAALVYRALHDPREQVDPLILWNSMGCFWESLSRPLLMSAYETVCSGEMSGHHSSFLNRLTFFRCQRVFPGNVENSSLLQDRVCGGRGTLNKSLSLY